MTFEIKDYFETPVILEPRVELYTVYDFMGKELPGLAIVLDMPIQGADEKEQFAILTKSFEELQKINPDVIGWIRVNDTNINYPLVQTDNDDTYMNTDAEGNYS